MVGHLLAEQALIAVGHLEERFGTALPERALVEDDDEATFYFSKVMGARFFASEVLVLAPRKAAGISSGERAALEMVF